MEVSSAFARGNGRLLQLSQHFHLADGTAVAVIDATIGLLELETRRLVSDPGGRLRELATTPDVLGLVG